MAAKTLEEMVAKVTELEEKKAKAAQKHQKQLDKINKQFDDEMKKVPYEREGVEGTFTVDADRVAYERDFRIKWLIRDFESNTRNLNTKIDNLKKRIYKIQNAPKPVEVKINPNLISKIKKIVDEWVSIEREELQTKKDVKPYYTNLTEIALLEFVVKPIAQEITLRCQKTIGEIASFSKIQFCLGQVDMTCWNTEGVSVHLWATFVEGHDRTSCRGKEFSVSPHVRVFTR